MLHKGWTCRSAADTRSFASVCWRRCASPNVTLGLFFARHIPACAKDEKLRATFQVGGKDLILRFVIDRGRFSPMRGHNCKGLISFPCEPSRVWGAGPTAGHRPARIRVSGSESNTEPAPLARREGLEVSVGRSHDESWEVTNGSITSYFAGVCPPTSPGSPAGRRPTGSFKRKRRTRTCFRHGWEILARYRC